MRHTIIQMTICFPPIRVQSELLPTERYADRVDHVIPEQIASQSVTQKPQISSSDNADFGLRHSYGSRL